MLCVGRRDEDGRSDAGSKGKANGMVSTSARMLLLGGSAIRVAYGLGALLAPGRMVSAEYAPDTHGLADPRLLLRAFGGHQLVTGCLTLTSTRSRSLARAAATLSLLIDASDVASAVLEQRNRSQRDQTITGGYIISGVGMIAFAAALCALYPTPQTVGKRRRRRATERKDR